MPHLIHMCVNFNSLFEDLEKYKLLSAHQFGFWTNDSSVDQLLFILHDIYTAFDTYPGLESCGVFLDMSQALNKVWREGLIFKLKSMAGWPLLLKSPKNWNSYILIKSPKILLKISLSPKILLRFYIQFLFSAQYSIPIFSTSIFIFIGKLSSRISCNLVMICKSISKLFKACVRYFLPNFYFWLSDSPSKTIKNIFYFI